MEALGERQVQRNLLLLKHFGPEPDIRLVFWGLNELVDEGKEV